MPGTRAEQNLQMPPPPRTDKAGKCHAVARGGGEGGRGGAVGAAGIDVCIITRKDLT